MRRDFKALGLVALRKESVDRNAEAVPAMTKQAQSLSARRAWIEMQRNPAFQPLPKVALRKESVDRNTSKDKNTMQVPWSLSARRAWIEILMLL